jgi:hypothetical protein
MIQVSIFLLTLFFSYRVYSCEEEVTLTQSYKDSLEQLLQDEKTIDIHTYVGTKALMGKLNSSEFVCKKRELIQKNSINNLISIDSLMQEMELQKIRLSPQESASAIVQDNNKLDQYFKLNAQHLKYHEDDPSANPHAPIIRSKPDENFTKKEMPRDIAQLFVSLKMQQKIDAKRKW